MMHQYPTRVLDVLNFPLRDRISQLSMIVETCSMKELQDAYPQLINSIFGMPDGSTGWGLRIVTERDIEFNLMYQFFNPHSSFFRMIYRLMKDTNKYDIPISYLPLKLKTMLESGRYSSCFYNDLVNIDNFRRQVISLSLNAFDYFMFHFVIHGQKNFQKFSPAALMINNENLKTVYFCLVADYLCNFLPSDPNSMILPQIDCSPFKSMSSAMSTMPMLSMLPTKQPKYLLLSALSHQIQSPPKDPRLNSETHRASSWRSESVMTIFIDCWLRYDFDENRDLPGTEFIRMIRILIKQLHYFSNAAEMDNTTISILRHQSRPLLNARIYPFLKSIIARWPLDSSFLFVLELYLSFIQPWRYMYNRDLRNLNMEIIIPDRFRSFIAENLVTYTQIFVRLLPRFSRMDFNQPKNALMLYRLMKVFNQPMNLIQEIEKSFNHTSAIHSPHQSYGETSGHSSTRSPNNSFNRSSSQHNHSLNYSAIDDSNYVHVFSQEVTEQIYELMQRVYMAKIKSVRDLETVEKKMHNKYGIIQRIMKFLGLFSLSDMSFSITHEENKKTPMYLDFSLNTLSPIFNIRIEDTLPETELRSSQYQEDSDNEESKSGFLNITPSNMKNQLSNISYSGDPALIPIMNSEITVVVRLLHELSCKLNVMFESEIQELYERQDIYGKIGRQILNPPIETRCFDKSQGFSELKVEHLGPRICLRKLGSWKVIAVLITSFLMGHFFFSNSSFGFVLFCIIAFGVIMIKALLAS